jgi:hypothetical protein
MISRRFKQPTPFEESISGCADEIRAIAEALPPGSQERELLERKARQAATANHIHKWLTSPGLRPPE